MILHFIRDEKVVESIIENYNKTKGENLFLIFVKDELQSLKYISEKTLSQQNVIKYNYTKTDINNCISQFSVKAILLHSLHHIFASTINAITNNVKIGWIAWGYDIYSLPKISTQIYAPATKSLLKKINRKLFAEQYFKSIPLLSDLYYKCIKRRKNPASEIQKSFRKINYFITYLEEDFHVFSKYYVNQMQFVYSSFCNIEQYLAGNKSFTLFEDAENILIGNSNTPESNHLDVLNLLVSQKLRFGLAKLYTPLSYGGNQQYKSAVKFKGNEIFGNSFFPLEDFMGRDEYVSILRSCSTGIFYHFRQQALGNIITMLYLGARIYMSPENPTYKYLSRIGIEVFDLEHDFKEFGNSKLNERAVEKNRQILSSLFGEDQVVGDLNHLNDTLCQ